MGLFAYALAGGSFALIGAWESLVSSIGTHKIQPSPTSGTAQPRAKTTSSSSSVTSIAVSLLSVFFVMNSMISLSDALNTKDQTGVILQLEVISIALLFFLYGFLGLLTHFSKLILLPSPVLNLLCLFGFVEEFLLFYLQRKDPDGIENRYFDLFCVPIGICIVCTILELKSPKARFSRLGRGIGLIFQGMWIIQMGFSFYSSAISNGCFLSEKSRGNFTVKCKGHMEYHRSRAISTLQFNCHLALLVVLVTSVFYLICKIVGISGEFTEYRPLGAEMQSFDGHNSRFTLDSDEDEDRSREEGNGEDHKVITVVPESGVNGYNSH
ncbi:hypothetical protein NMG60_11028353 [Bertholletia excelsa]